MMDLLWSLWPLVVIALMVLAAIKLARLVSQRDRTPYVKRQKLVTKTELRFYHELRRAVDDDWEIFAMVRIADILRVPTGMKNRRKWLNKILAKHIDFVLCDQDNLEILAGIELDDRSHDRADRQKRDRFVNSAFEDAGIPLLRIPTQSSYDTREIRRLIDDAI